MRQWWVLCGAGVECREVVVYAKSQREAVMVALREIGSQRYEKVKPIKVQLMVINRKKSIRYSDDQQ